MVHVLPATWFDIGCINIRAAQATMNCAIVPAANSCSSFKRKGPVCDWDAAAEGSGCQTSEWKDIQEMDVLIDPLFWSICLNHLAPVFTFRILLIDLEPRGRFHSNSSDQLKMLNRKNQRNNSHSFTSYKMIIYCLLKSVAFWQRI